MSIAVVLLDQAAPDRSARQPHGYADPTERTRGDVPRAIEYVRVNSKTRK